MGKIIELDPQGAEIQQQKVQQVEPSELENYKKLGILQVVSIQGDDDEDCERQWLKVLGLADDEILYAVEAGSALQEVRAEDESI